MILIMQTKKTIGRLLQNINLLISIIRKGKPRKANFENNEVSQLK